MKLQVEECFMSTGRAALETLSEEDKLLLSLLVIEEMDPSEIARVVDSTEDEVRERLAGLLDALDQRLSS